MKLTGKQIHETYPESTELLIRVKVGQYYGPDDHDPEGMLDIEVPDHNSLNLYEWETLDIVEPDKDTARLDHIEKVGAEMDKRPGYSQWTARPSSMGRGYRLHQTSSHEPRFDTAREAIDADIQSWKEHQGH